MRTVANEFHWKLNMGAIAMVWRAGCIIRRFLVLSVELLIGLLLDLSISTFDEDSIEVADRSEKNFKLISVILQLNILTQK